MIRDLLSDLPGPPGFRLAIVQALMALFLNDDGLFLIGCSGMLLYPPGSKLLRITDLTLCHNLRDLSHRLVRLWEALHGGQLEPLVRFHVVQCHAFSNCIQIS